MITPALLILAAGSLIGATLVRLGRIVDRVRAMSTIGSRSVEPSEIINHDRRARLALGAIMAYFTAVALFVAAGISIAMVLLVAGAGAMVVECREAASLISADLARLRNQRL
jgi:hypothetical protein